MYLTDNPRYDADRHARLEAAWRGSRPRCCGCGEPIGSSLCLGVDGDKYCMDCKELVWERVRGAYLEQTE